ncbi:MFS transporter [Patulibacter sp.]|uniref:MFS transporter n=1 Tax=Patulibacter sp. TaxID=1912859 RepID=UPI0027213FC6|nr:MFS transporter [Patulibacter sp.]MDO9408979.1 MFS transporter [Patulibacter sp.]
MSFHTPSPRPPLGVWSPPILLLAAVAFAVGSAEFVGVGAVPEIARGLGVGEDAAGLTVSLYAAGVALAALPVSVAVGHLPPRRLLVTLLAIFAAAHVVMVAAPSLPVLLAGRLVAAATQAVALGAALHAASTLVAPERRSTAVALVFGGLLSAMFLAAPAGTVVADVFGWRAAFGLIGVFGLALAAAVAVVVPRTPGQDAVGWSALRLLRRPAVHRPLATSAAQLLAAAVLFAYLGVYLERVLGVRGSGVAVGLALFGAAGLVGNAFAPTIARRVAHRAPSLLLGVVGLALVTVGLAGGHPGPALAAVAVWGAAQMALQPILTDRAIVAGGSFAATLNVAGVNAGIAIGGLLGGAVVGAGSPEALPWVAAALTVGVLVPAALGSRAAGATPTGAPAAAR